MISYRSNMLGLRPPAPAPKRPGVVRRLIAARAPQVPYTWAEDEQLIAMRGKGHSYAEIGRALGRKHGSVKSAAERLKRAGRLAARDMGDAEAASEQA